MKTPRFILALGAFFVAGALIVSGCGSSSGSGSVPDNSVATVAGNRISTPAFNHWMYVAAKGQAAQSPGSPVIVPNDPPDFTKCIAQARAEIPQLKKTPDKTLKADCQTLFTSLSGQVMDFLIKAYWYQALAHKLGIKVTDAQVQQALATAKKSGFPTDAQFEAFLKSSGQTLQDITYRVRVNQIYSKLAARHKTTVTPAAIAAYYNSHKSQFGTPESRDMRIVLAKTAAAASAAKSALHSGQSWTVVAKKYSIDPTTRNKGGLITGVTAGQQDVALSKAAFAAPANKLLGPVHGQFGYYVLTVTKITPATQRSLAQAQRLIKQTLTGQQETAAQTAINNQAKQAYLAKTKCRSAYAMADCAGYKPPKTAASPGAAGSSGAAGAGTAPTTTSAP